MTLPEISASLRAEMRAIGPAWGTDVQGNVEKMIKGFSAVLAGRAMPAMEIRRAQPYGAHERQVLDLYLPRQPNGMALLFLHGGAFTTGHRNASDEIYANVLTYFARHGVTGINGEYRLAPEAPFPGATEDVAAMVAWVHSRAASLAIDPSKLFLMGHSTGGAHAASYAYDRRFHPASGPGIAGAVIASGRVRADNSAHNPNARRVEAYYGEDAALYESRSGIGHVDASSVPTFIAWAEYENPLLDVYSLELAYKLASLKRRAPPTMRLAGHNHTSLIAHFDTQENALGRAILSFMHSPRG